MYDTKTAKTNLDGSERFHPFGLLDEFRRTGNDRFRRLFLEYATAFKGERQLVWQRSLSFKAALRAFSGIWADRDDLDELYADLRRRGQERLERLWVDRPDFQDEPASPDR